MPRVLRSYTPRKRKHGGGRPPTYPWGTWLDGQIRRLKRGDDFPCTLKAMENQIRRQSARRKVLVSVHLEHDTQSLVIEPQKVPRRSRHLLLPPDPPPRPLPPPLASSTFTKVSADRDPE